tara:strand:- start:310 stop:1554 length:1245 start_codon:yes stop_codon:yes gene_type:complete
MYYKGNNIGLNYDAANGTWSFNNEPQDYIDKNAFSTPDPIFNYTPPADEADDEEDTNCPEGYIYDNTLKQCVPDPAKQNQYSQQQNQGGNNSTSPVQIAGTNRTTTDGNFIANDDEYDKMTASELVENYKQRGFIKKNDKGELVIDFNRVKRKGGILDSLLGRMGQPQVEGMASLNKVIDYLVDKNILTQNQIYGTTAAGQTQFNNEVVIPTIAKFEADYYGIPYSDVIAPGFGDSIFGTKQSVQKFDDYMSKKLEAFSTVANNVVNTMPSTMYQNYSASAGDSGEAFDKASDLENIERRKKEAEAIAAEIKAKQEEEKLKELASQGSGTSEEADKAIDDLSQTKKDDDKDDGGTSSGGIVIGPNPGDAGGTSTYSSNSNSSSTGQSANQGPAGGPTPPPPSSAAESFKRYGRF